MYHKSFVFELMQCFETMIEKPITGKINIEKMLFFPNETCWRSLCSILLNT